MKVIDAHDIQSESGENRSKLFHDNALRVHRLD